MITNNNADTSCTKSVRQTILDLAQQHGVGTEPTALDLKAKAISYLSDNDTDGDDEAFQALVNLRRAKVLSTEEGHKMLLDLMEEDEQRGL